MMSSAAILTAQVLASRFVGVPSESGRLRRLWKTAWITGLIGAPARRHAAQTPEQGGHMINATLRQHPGMQRHSPATARAAAGAQLTSQTAGGRSPTRARTTVPRTRRIARSSGRTMRWPISIESAVDEELRNIAAALERVDNGRCGICDSRGGTIEEKRLSAVPLRNGAPDSMPRRRASDVLPTGPVSRRASRTRLRAHERSPVAYRARFWDRLADWPRTRLELASRCGAGGRAAGVRTFAITGLLGGLCRRDWRGRRRETSSCPERY